MKHVLSNYTRCVRPSSATIYCTIDPQLIYHSPSCDCVGSSLQSKHTLAILYEVGRYMLREFSQSAYQRSVPVKLASVWSICRRFPPVMLQCESHIWQCSHLNSNLPCNMVFKGWLRPCLFIIIFSDTLIVIWPHFHLAASLENVKISVILPASTKNFYFLIASLATIRGNTCN